MRSMIKYVPGMEWCRGFVLPWQALAMWLCLATVGFFVARAEDAKAAPHPELTAEPALKAHPHWAFQPIRNAAPPPVRNSRWVRTSVDAFILAGLEKAGIEASVEADKRSLLRRAAFDLTGLPPTPEQMEEFEADRSSEDFERVVERLLSSPAYGERWGRYWLDTARYADTKGYVFEEERRYPYSYTYRDYVVRAFNEDLPYDRFIVEQLAADLLDLGEDKRPLAALGFLTLGRRFLNNNHDIIDDRIDVVMRGTQGLTVTCARCHDHKYDPVSMKDYYALHGIFASSQEPSDKPMLGMASLPPEFPAFKKERDRRSEEYESFKKLKEEEALSEVRARTGDYWLAVFDAKALADASRFEAIARERKLDPGVARRWRERIQDWEKEPPSNPLAALWIAAAKSAGTNREALLAGTLDAVKSLPEGWLKQTLSTNPPSSFLALASRVSLVFTNLETSWKEMRSKNPSITALADESQEALRQFLVAGGSPAVVSQDDIRRLFDVPTAQKVRRLKRHVEEFEATHPGSPPKAMALVDSASPRNSRVLLRGNPGNPGPEVPRGFLAVLSKADGKPFTQGSGRLELARSITSRENPLTARVVVNRAWLHLFGAPLVDTTGDFGLRSTAPSHPELLDHLAFQFMENGWSLKKLHRTLMLSSTYRQSSVVRSDAMQVDPSNRLLWRANRRRLDLESMRDSLLAASGKLDFKAGGHPVDLLMQPFSGRRSVYGFIERQNLPAFFRTFDFASPDTTSSKRYSTTVPQQALYLLNSPFVAEQARALIQRLGPDQPSRRTERIQRLYQIVFQRFPVADELEFARAFLDEPLAGAKPPPPAKETSQKASTSEKDKRTPIPAPEPLGAWERYAQTLLVSNEFFFTD